MNYDKPMEDVIEAVFDSYFYNRDTKDMIDLCNEVIDRIALKKIDVKWTPDGNIIYGILSCLYGDYGTSPRSGFFYSQEIRDKMVYIITDYMDDLVEEEEK